MDENDVIGRLRSMGRAPLDDRSMAGRVGRAADAGRIRRRTTGLVAGGVAVLLGAPLAALAVSAAGDAPPPAVVTADAPPATGGDLSCAGPPPFSGATPDGATEEERAADREADAEAFEAWRAANCPPDETDGTVPDAPAAPGDCAGPPPFADQPAAPADPSAGVVPSPRAGEANALDATRAGCPDGAGEAENTQAGAGEPAAGAPPRSDCVGRPPFADQPAVPADPAAGVAPSPRAGEANALDATRAGCPDDGAAPPETAPPAEAPSPGPPSGTPSGPPADVTTGPPSGPPSGPPADVTTGPPSGTRSGPPADVTTGRPSGPPSGPPRMSPPVRRLERPAPADASAAPSAGPSAARGSGR